MRFGEEVSQLILGGYRVKFNSALMKVLANKVATNLSVA